MSESESQLTILLVEDDVAIANGLALNLKLEGFRAVVVGDGDAAGPAIEEHRPALILLDISLPKKNGLEVLSELREGGDNTPVVVLSARQNEFDKVSALRLGADDYVTKPFGVAELLARIAAVLRRLGSSTPVGGENGGAAMASDPSMVSDASSAGGADESPLEAGVGDEMLEFADVRVDVATRQVFRAGESVPITHLEFELLTFLLRNPDRVFSREQLLQRVWGVSHNGSPRTVDNFVRQLRAKLEITPRKPDHLVTVRGNGYRFIR